ncbi:MAG TPA: RluA family pseudouridine synthase [Anaeromyxobacteraceae bacterium]
MEVLHLDAHLAAVAKPPGRLVIPGRGPPEPSLRQDVEARLGPVWVVHRLDRGTSGLLLFARSAEVHRALNLAFDRREVEKVYLAVVRGPIEAELRVEVPLAPARRGRMRPGRRGETGARPAATAFRVVERLARPEAAALVEARPETGRTHQIRVHLAWAGAPLCFDPDYGPRQPIRDAAGAVVLDRTPLHAWRLALRHPATGAPLRLEAPLPADLERLLAWARRP